MDSSLGKTGSVSSILSVISIAALGKPISGGGVQWIRGLLLTSPCGVIFFIDI